MLYNTQISRLSQNCLFFRIGWFKWLIIVYVDWIRLSRLTDCYLVLTQLTFTNSEKAMAPHSSTLAWRIPWTEEPGGLQTMGSLRVGHNWVTSLSRIGEGNGNPLQCSCLDNPGMGEPGGLQPMGSHRVGHDWSDLAAAAVAAATFTKWTNSSNNCQKPQIEGKRIMSGKRGNRVEGNFLFPLSPSVPLRVKEKTPSNHTEKKSSEIIWNYPEDTEESIAIHYHSQ